MNFHLNYPLMDKNHLKINAFAREYFEFDNADELHSFFCSRPVSTKNILILGGGSNLVLASKIIPLVIKPNNRGIEISESDEYFFVKAQAGESWPEFTEFLLKRGIYGLECLSLIPGTVGASPIQNIGAYGVEVSEYIFEVECYDILNKKFFSLSNSECDFSYRSSSFKLGKFSSFIILNVTFKFNKLYNPIYSTRIELIDNGNMNPVSVSEEIKRTRTSKLPDPETEPNVGSFFKNPLISYEEWHHLQSRLSEAVNFKTVNGIKLSAANLIELAGWKGKYLNGIGMSKRHSLVLTNLDSSSGLQVLEYVERLREDIYRQYEILLEIEPSIWI